MAKVRNKIPRGSYLDLAVQKVIPRSLETVGDLQLAIKNNQLTPDQLEGLAAYQNDMVNKDLKTKALKDGSLTFTDAVRSKDVTTKEAIDAAMTNIRAQNIQEATRAKVQEELSKTPSRDRLKKWEAQSLLQLQKLKSGGVR